MTKTPNERGAARMRDTRAVLLTASLFALSSGAQAQQTIDCRAASNTGGSARSSRRVVIHWQPAVPRAGTLFRISARPPTLHDAPRPSGAPYITPTFSVATVAGEPVHFRSASDSIVAWAPVPIDSTSGVTLSVRCDSGDSALIRIPTRAGNYRLEKLRVAPRFSAPPDSTLADRIKREADEAAVVSRGAHDTPRMWTSPFVVPRASRITSAFGGGRTFNGTVTSRHMGTDFAGAVGAPVHASNRGVVRLVGSFYLGGNVIYIDHGEGIVTAYLHLSRQLVLVGDTVARGALIGHVGATGRVTGPHLHLITRYGAVTVDPASLFSQR